MEQEIEKEISQVKATFDRQKELIKQQTELDEQEKKRLMEELEKKEKAQNKEKSKK